MKLSKKLYQLYLKAIHDDLQDREDIEDSFAECIRDAIRLESNEEIPGDYFPIIDEKDVPSGQLICLTNKGNVLKVEKLLDNFFIDDLLEEGEELIAYKKR